MELGGKIIPQLHQANASGYFNLFADGQLYGYQILANFRLSNEADEQALSAEKFAPSVSLQSVIEENVAAELVRDRIVIIGYFDESDRNADFFNTPHGRLAGATIHGQLASQIISKVLDGRSLIWWWIPEVEFIWIVGYSLVGGFVVWGIVRPIQLTVVLSSVVICLYLSCAMTMMFTSGWIPFIPPLLATAITVGITTARNHRLRHP
ncbi:MAG: CHASE2 domain-containing protein [Cyanothece sp. SIO2G6]|nr:CHASE2 domain-containing protein [Cyanothece sp. SIO2G6]